MTAKNTIEENSFLMRSATYMAVTVACILIVVKIWAYIATGSVSILSTLVDSLLDFGASFVNLLAVKHALTPADDEHRFGHGKAEAIAGLLQSAFIVGSAIFLLLQAFERLANPEPIEQSSVGILVMVISISLTLVLVLYQRYVVRKTKSVAISADSLHYAGDILVNISVIIALLLSVHMEWIYADSIFAIGIAGYICYNAWSIIRTSYSELMDEELPDEERSQIEKLILSQEGVLGVHDLRTRKSGQHVFIQMHLDLDPAQSLQAAHDIADKVEMTLMKAFPNAEVLVHQDPAPTELLNTN